MKILETNFHRGWGGQPTYILMMARGLADLGHDVVIAAPAGSILAERARAAGLPTFEALAFRKTKHLAAAARDAFVLARHLREGGYDLINSHGSQDVWTCVAARALAGRRAPLVYTRNNTKAVRPHAANRWLYGRQIDHLIVASRTVLERYAPLLEGGTLSDRRVSVVHGTYRSDQFHRGLDRGAARARLGFGPATPLIGVVARLVRDKGHAVLFRAAVEILKRRPEVRFLLVGTGTLEGELHRLAGDLGIDGAVHFLGFREDIPEITAALDVSVLPSVDCDASPAVLKEALACGVPAVASDIGGAAEILREGVTGLVVPPDDPRRLAEAILSLVDAPERAREMGRIGSGDVAERFPPSRLAAETVAVYRGVLERGLEAAH